MHSLKKERQSGLIIRSSDYMYHMSKVSGPMRYNEVSVIVLAGGNSSRMSFPKLLLPFSSDKLFIQQIADIYNEVINGDKICVVNESVLKANENYIRNVMSGWILVGNSNTESGRTYSIKSGLKMTQSNCVFIQNTDNPFVNKDLLVKMLALAPLRGYVSPRNQNKGGHPVLLCGQTVSVVREADDTCSLREILSGENRVPLETEDSSVSISIDNPELYSDYFPQFRDYLAKQLCKA